MAPQVEQLKGLSKGLALAAPMAAQHIEILKQQFPGLDDSEKLKLGRDVVSRIVTSLSDAGTKQREELLKTTGKFDGTVMAALAVVRQIESAIANYDRLKQEEKELDNPFPQDAAPAGDNGGPPEKKKAAPKKSKSRKVKRVKPAMAN